MIEVPEKTAEEIAGASPLDDPRKATRNSAVCALAIGTAGATGLAQTAGLVELLNPLVTLSLFAFMAFALPFMWSAGGLDVALAARMQRFHERGHARSRGRRGARDAPVYFRMARDARITPWGTAWMAFEPYSLSLTLGVIVWSSLIGVGPEGAPIQAPSAVLAGTIALASMAALLVATWVVPPLWLLRSAGVRVCFPDRGLVASVDAWYLLFLGPFMGVASLGTLFIVFAIGGLPLRPALYSFLTISTLLFPIAFAGTYFYRARREGRAAAELGFRLKGQGLRAYRTVEDALAAEGRRSRGRTP